MKKSVLLIPLIILLFFTLTYAENKTCIYFFYGDGCPHCEKVEPYINELANRTDMEVQKFEIYYNQDNSYLLDTFFTVHEVSEDEKGIPAVFIGNDYLIGDVNIQNSLEKAISKNAGAACPTPERIAEEPPVENDTSVAPWQIATIIVLVTVIAAGYILYQRRR